MRSYPRSFGYRFNWGSFVTPAIKVLLIANTAVFLLETLVRLSFGTEGYLWILQVFGLIPYAVTHGLRIWQPFTYLFLHGGLLHLLLNMFVLWMFGRDLELSWGRRRFYFFYFLCGVGAGVVNIIAKTVPLFWGAQPSGIPTIGASGAIYGVLVACAIVFPDRQVWLIPFPVTLSMRVYVAIMVGIEFFGTLGATGDNISHVSHLGGILVAYLYLRRGSFFYGMRNSYLDWQRRRLRRKFEVYQQKHGDEPPSRPDHWVN